MTVREILAIGDPLLHKRAIEVDPDEIAGERVQSIINDLIDTMRAANGAGLAANQIGETVRIVVLEVDRNPRYPYKPPIPLTVAINPKLESLDGETVVINEGCLSVPLRGDVERFVKIRVRFFDRDGSKQCLVAQGLTAGTWQHECDHLNGTLFIDRADPTTLSTLDNFERFHRDAFLERIAPLLAQQSTEVDP